VPHLHLKAVLGAPLWARHHSRIQNQQIQARQRGGQLVGGCLDTGEVSQIQLLHADLALQ